MSQERDAAHSTFFPCNTEENVSLGISGINRNDGTPEVIKLAINTSVSFACNDVVFSAIFFSFKLLLKTSQSRGILVQAGEGLCQGM